MSPNPKLSLDVIDLFGNRRTAWLRWGSAEIDTLLYKLDDGPLLFLQPDGTLLDTTGHRYHVCKRVFRPEDGSEQLGVTSDVQSLSSSEEAGSPAATIPKTGRP